MKVSEIGEFELIETISRLVKEGNISQNPDGSLLIGIGDDSAAWKCRGRIQLCTTDCLIQDVHFDLKYTGWQDLGMKSIAVNLSDIAAMGGIPLYALVSLAMPAETEVEEVSMLYRGMIRIANKYKVLIVGGNISKAEKLMINITVHGYSKGSGMLTRASARAGDQVAVTGFTGLAAAGLLIFKKQLAIEKEAAALFCEAHLRPNPRVREGQMLVKHGVKTGIDISDGLLADMGHICDASGVSALIREDHIPINPALQNAFKEDYMELAMTGGEDYELLFTATPSVMRKVQANSTFTVTIIGEIVKQGNAAVTVVDASGKSVVFPRAGWNHFR